MIVKYALSGLDLKDISIDAAELGPFVYSRRAVRVQAAGSIGLSRRAPDGIACVL